jgi:hypothetical protein
VYAVIKPNRAPSVYQRVSYQYIGALYIKTAHNLNLLNSHLSNNNHWGAVAYLSTSVYGVGDAVCLDSTCSSNHKKIYNNGYFNESAQANSDSVYRYQTGCGPISAYSDSYGATCNAYNTAVGQQASATGNVYGVYDLAGGVNESQLGVSTCYDDNTLGSGGFDGPGGHSGFSYSDYYCYGGGLYYDLGSGSIYSPAPENPIAWPDYKYLNIYPGYSVFTKDNYSGSNDQCVYQLCGGQALHEVSVQRHYDIDYEDYDAVFLHWGSDYSSFASVGHPWFMRGGRADNGEYAGLFNSRSTLGDAYDYVGWRAVVGVY